MLPQTKKIVGSHTTSTSLWFLSYRIALSSQALCSKNISSKTSKSTSSLKLKKNPHLQLLGISLLSQTPCSKKSLSLALTT